MVFQENFWRLTVTVRLQTNEYFKNMNFSPTFLKPWAHVSDNFACVVGGPH